MTGERIAALVTRPAFAPLGWGIAAVLSVLIPGLGQAYVGRLPAGALWFLATAFGYWASLVPGFLIHALCIWFAYRDARAWNGY